MAATAAHARTVAALAHLHHELLARVAREHHELHLRVLRLIRLTRLSLFPRSIMLASKFFDDVYYNNAYYARVGGITNSEVNSLEMELLRMISFSLLVIFPRRGVAP